VDTVLPEDFDLGIIAGNALYLNRAIAAAGIKKAADLTRTAWQNPPLTESAWTVRKGPNR
jgi:hypothetical protein